MNQGFTIVGGLVFLLIRFFFSLGDAIFIYLLAIGALLFVGNRRGWFAPAAGQGDAAPDVAPDPGLVERVRFNSAGLHFAARQRGRWHWRDAGSLGLTLASCQGSLGPVESDPDVVAYCRNLIEFGSSLVEARPLESTSFRGLVCILKIERRPGYVYAGRLHVLLGAHSVIFFLVAGEKGITGQREAVVTSEALRAGVIEIDAAAGNLKHWFKDAYDSKYDSRTVRSIADDDSYDVRFPDHPLSRIRRFLRQIEASFTLLSNSAAATDSWPHDDAFADLATGKTIH
jgi:hypothetical protein